MTCKMYKKHVAWLAILMLAVALPDGSLAQGGNETSQQAARAARTTVTGRVTDASGAPMIGVTVVVEGTSTGTSTNALGEYTLQASPNDKLSFTFLGYVAQSIPVGTRSFIEVTLEDDSQMIEDVIVIGYGTTTRRRAVGAVDQIKSEAIAERAVSNMTQALQGTSPSLVVQQRSFDPTDQQLNLNIRGIGTMNDNSPLIVIDGLVSDGGSFNKLNPSDIESISVLKDAGTAAIYGSRAANGVLLVTTKKGRRNQAPTVQFSAIAGIQNPQVLYRPVEGYQNATLTNLAKVNSGQAPLFTTEQIRDLYENGNGKYFMDEIVENAWQQTYNLSISGGGDNSTYMVSAGYYDQQSNYVGKWGLQRYNFRTNLTTEYRKLKVTALLSYVRNNTTKPSGGNLNNDASRIPTYYYYKMQDPATGHYLLNDVLTQSSPLGILREGGTEKHNNDYVNANVSLEYKIIDGLKLRGVLGTDIFSDHRYKRTQLVDFYSYRDPEKLANTVNTDLDGEDYNRKAFLINSQIILDYDKTFGRHHVAAMVGGSNESFTSQDNQVRLKNTDPTLGIKGDGTIAVLDGSWNTPQGTTRRSITSVFGRVGYDFDDKYFIEASFRYDGSSKFPKDNRWGFFPSVSLGWQIADEDWMEGYRRSVGNLKLRGSWGTLGNQSIGDYQYFTTFDVYADTYGFNNVSVGGAGFQIGNDKLKWEVSRTFNVGLDASFFNNSLTVLFDFFHKKTTDILVTPQTPLTFGTKLPNYNAGAMKTLGWELVINYRLNHNKDFSHNFNFSLGDAWNEVLSYEGFEDIIGTEEYWRIMREGLPFNSYYGYKVDGIFQNYEEIASSAKPGNLQLQPGDLKFKDRNGDGIIDTNDRYYLGNAFPRYSIGFTYDFRWRWLDVSIFLQGVLKRDMMLRGELVEPFHANYGYTMYEHQLDFWTPANTDARYPRLASGGDAVQNNWKMGSDIYLFDAKYLRVKNLAIGFTLPEEATRKIGMKKLRIYANTQNLFTFSNLSFIDPESSEYGTNMNSGGANSGRVYPNLRYFGMGLDITF